MTGKKGSRILNAVNPGRLNIDVIETGFSQFRLVLVIGESTRNTAHPELYALLYFGRYATSDYNIGDGKTTTRLENSKRFLKHAIFVAGKVNNAIRDNDIHGIVRKRNVLNFAFKKLDIG